MPKVYPQFHGSPYDRGSADSYYGRGRHPHWYKDKDQKGAERIEEGRMTADEIEAYHAGFDDNEEAGDYKDWG